jgi:TfoX/Sxy family transcriptional regulator of competence genes
MFRHDSQRLGIIDFSRKKLLSPSIEYSVQNQLAFSRSGFSMAFNEALAERIRHALARKKNIDEKKMFGGIGFLLNGNMLVGVWKDSLIVRVGPESHEDVLLEPHVKDFDITGRPMKGWVLVEPEGVEVEDQLKGWIERAVKFVRKLPGK